ncbi:LacI family DNA-binding transcriptional regulator [Streptomyces tubercidicus]|uniref:LacI family DNA-binding transcriptional regulator n=1 Tax=Streptomyces tubercidicus TaxID=47759 RepID=UPI0034667C6A
MAEPKDSRARRSTLSDVAAVAKVDTSVVSRLVNNDPRLKIRDTTRKRVLDAIALLDYRPNAAARSLRTARTRTLGLLIPDFANPVYAEIIKGAERAAAATGCALVTGSVKGNGGDADTYLDLLGHGRVDGLLLATPITEAKEAELSRLGMPWLLLNHSGQSRRHVVLDDERAAGIAVDHLIALGHRRIGHISGPRGADTARQRRAGYTAALRRAKIARQTGLVTMADYTAAGGAAAMERLLKLPEPPTAVFVANIASAIGSLHTAHRLGVRIPDDVSVVAVHDLALASHLVPPLTTVRMPMAELGARAVHLMLEGDPHGPVQEVVGEPTELVLRESTAPPTTR